MKAVVDRGERMLHRDGYQAWSRIFHGSTVPACFCDKDGLVGRHSYPDLLNLV